MKWNWTDFFNKIKDLKALNLAVESEQDYQENQINVQFIKTGREPNNLIYSPWSEKFFALNTISSQISIDKKYLSLFIEDAIKERDFYQNYHDKYKFEYVTYGFFLNMHLAKNVSSGASSYKDSIKKLFSLIQTKSVSIQGSELISSQTQLEQFLKKNITGFTSFTSEIV